MQQMLHYQDYDFAHSGAAGHMRSTSIDSNAHKPPETVYGQDANDTYVDSVHKAPPDPFDSHLQSSLCVSSTAEDAPCEAIKQPIYGSKNLGKP